MRKYQIVKQYIEKKAQVVDILDNLVDKLSIGKGELAEKMGYDKASFSRIYNGKEQTPERFLLIAKLMLENIQLREKLVAIESAQRTLTALTAPGAPHYIANEFKISSTSAEQVADAIAADTARKVSFRNGARKPRSGSPPL